MRQDTSTEYRKRGVTIGWLLIALRCLRDTLGDGLAYLRCNTADLLQTLP